LGNVLGTAELQTKRINNTMKLSEAQDYQRRILDLTKQLNTAICEASKDGLEVVLEINESHQLGVKPSVPFIMSNVLINPQDIDLL
jgi:hypothetical protein